MLVGLGWSRGQEGLAVFEGQQRGAERSLRLVADYDAPNVSEEVVRIMMSRTDHINWVVWWK